MPETWRPVRQICHIRGGWLGAINHAEAPAKGRQTQHPQKAPAKQAALEQLPSEVSRREFFLRF